MRKKGQPSYSREQVDAFRSELDSLLSLVKKPDRTRVSRAELADKAGFEPAYLNALLTYQVPKAVLREKHIAALVQALVELKVNINQSQIIRLLETFGPLKLDGWQGELLKGFEVAPVIMLVRPRACPTPPPKPAYFGGRSTMLNELKAELVQGGTLAITAVHGLGGIGKTTLARQLANEVFNEKLFRAVLWAEITRYPDPVRLLSGWAVKANPDFKMPEGIGLTELASLVKDLLEDLIREKCEKCEPARTLVVLDDVWNIETADLLRQAVPGEATILITTRSLQTAVRFKAAPIELPFMSSDEGTNLLAGYFKNKFRGVAVGQLTEMADALGGHPLALILAANRVLLSKDKAAALTEQLAQYSRSLPTGTPFSDLQLEQGEIKDDNLTLALSYSYEALSEEQKRLLRATGILIYDQPFNLEFLAAIWNYSDASAVEEAADQLRLLSLLEGVPGRAGWWRQHPLLQAYLLALLKASPEYEEVKHRYRQFVLQISRSFKLLPPQDWPSLEIYLPHIQVLGDTLVTEFAANRTDPDWLHFSQSFALNTAVYVERRPELNRRAWLELGWQVSQSLDDKLNQALFLNELGSADYTAAHFDKAYQNFADALALTQELGATELQAQVLTNLGTYYTSQSQHEQGLEISKQALSLYQQLNDVAGQAYVLDNIGGIYFNLKEWQQAADYLNQALPLVRLGGNKSKEANILNGLASVYGSLNQFENALTILAEAVELARLVGDKQFEGIITLNIGTISWRMGRREIGIERVEQAYQILQAVNPAYAATATARRDEMRAILAQS